MVNVEKLNKEINDLKEIIQSKDEEILHLLSIIEENKEG